MKFRPFFRDGICTSFGRTAPNRWKSIGIIILVFNINTDADHYPWLISMENNGIFIPEDKWFLNLHKVGNVGSASAYLMLEELFHSGQLKSGQKILLMVPESARFSYTYALFTVV